MSETIEFELVRPVNPTGSSFIRYVWGAVGARNRAVLQEYRQEFSKLVKHLGSSIKNMIGSDKLITGKIAVDVENGKPVRIVARDIQIWRAYELGGACLWQGAHCWYSVEGLARAAPAL
jgi:hypothetical protein